MFLQPQNAKRFLCMVVLKFILTHVCGWASDNPLPLARGILVKGAYVSERFAEMCILEKFWSKVFMFKLIFLPRIELSWRDFSQK